MVAEKWNTVNDVIFHPKIPLMESNNNVTKYNFMAETCNLISLSANLLNKLPSAFLYSMDLSEVCDMCNVVTMGRISCCLAHLLYCYLRSEHKQSQKWNLHV